MPLSPQDIVRKEFREAFRGYNQADVDLFLDEVVEEYTRLSEENQKMKVRLAALQQEVARLREGKEPALPSPSRASGAPAPPDPARIEAEVRARLRRYLEDQLRQLDDGGPQTATVQRLARELPSSEPPPPPPPPAPKPEQPPRPKGGAEPFWAGE